MITTTDPTVASAPHLDGVDGYVWLGAHDCETNRAYGQDTWIEFWQHPIDPDEPEYFCAAWYFVTDRQGFMGDKDRGDLIDYCPFCGVKLDPANT
jgi:hypothetical protein